MQTNLVCGLIEGKFKEHKVSPKCLRTIAAGDEVQIGQGRLVLSKQTTPFLTPALCTLIHQSGLYFIQVTLKSTKHQLMAV